MKKLLLAILVCSVPAWADIAVTPGSGKTVATTTDQSREFQQVVVTTMSINNVNGVPTTVGYATGNSSVPVNVINTVTVNTHAVTQSGVFQVEPGTNTFKVAGPVSQAGIFQVEPGTNTFKVSVQSTINQPVLIVGTPTVQGTLTDDGQATSGNLIGVLSASAQTNYAGSTADVLGRNELLDTGTDGLLWTANLPALRPTSYSASTGTITTATSATDIAAICGNATNMVLLYGVRASCTETTAGNVALTIVKRSTAEGAGAFSTMTAVAQDTNYVTAFSSVTWYLANPTVGTFAGNLDNYKLGCMASATASPNDIYISPSDWKMKPIVLRGTGQCVALNLGGVTVTGGQFTVTFDWIETATITP